MVFNGRTESLEQLNRFVEETVVLTLNPERPFEARKEKPVCFSENLKSAGFLLLLLLAFKVGGARWDTGYSHGDCTQSSEVDDGPNRGCSVNVGSLDKPTPGMSPMQRILG